MKRFASCVLVISLVLISILAVVSATTTTLQPPTHDSYVDECSPSSNFGSETIFTVFGWSPGPPFECTDASERGFVLFNITSIPTDAIIFGAELNLFRSGGTGSSSRTYQVNRATSTWIESTITWFNQPSVTSSGQVGITITGGTTGFKVWNVTTIFNAWIAGSANYGIRVFDTNEGNPTAFFSNFKSSEHADTADRPKLRVEWAQPTTGAPTITTIAADQITHNSANLKGQLTAFGDALFVDAFFEWKPYKQAGAVLCFDMQTLGVSNQINDLCEANEGTNTGSSDIEGQFGRARDFESTESDSVSVADNASLDLTTGFTAAAWVNPEAVSVAMEVIRKEGAYRMLLNGNILRMTTWSGASARSDQSVNVQISANVWTYITVTYDTINHKLYKNGVLTDTFPRTGNMDTNTALLYVGSFGGTSAFFDGILDEVQVFDRALSLGEIQDLMAVTVTSPKTDIGECALCPDPPVPFSRGISGLVNNTQYFFRGVGEGNTGWPSFNSTPTGYGSVLNFTTLSLPAVLPPTVVTVTIINLFSNSVTLGGQLTSLGNSTYVHVRFKWGMDSTLVTHTLTTIQNRTTTGFFAEPVGGLIVDTLYYYRANATGNGTGPWAEGSILSFVTTSFPIVLTTIPSDVTTRSAIIHGSLFSLGTASSVQVSFGWGPLNVTFPFNETTPQTLTSAGGFSASILNLEPATPYRFQAKAVGNGIGVGDIFTFSTQASVAPNVTTSAASAISIHSAQLNGFLNSFGTTNQTYVTVYFEYGLTSSNLNLTTSLLNQTNTGGFGIVIANLQINTTYFFRAFASSVDGTFEGALLNFTTAFELTNIEKVIQYVPSILVFVSVMVFFIIGAIAISNKRGRGHR